MGNRIRKIWNTVTTALVVLILLPAVLLGGVRLLGMDVFMVQSGSMEPAYPVGALVCVKRVDAAQLKAGDVITFDLGGGVRGTHRIIEVVEDDSTLAFRTKGDANAYADNGLVAKEDVIGKVVLSAPYLGFVIAWIQHPPGMYIAMTGVAVILLLTILPGLIFDEKKQKNRREPNEEHKEDPA